ncbi:uncharacterized protein LOC131036298 [Cryptomeria japonica]|uniref:uncharacterized protein LOC131036298 n=1 Tax=Cryptomeria japonica TaxID=3369 RepID=UPI0027DA91FD|nr:uncharacterized protein LOC131036298 [Cryptomeria japonica]
MAASALLTPTNYHSRSCIAHCLSPPHSFSSSPSSSSSCYMSYRVFWAPLKQCMLWKESLRQSKTSPSTFLPIKDSGNLNKLTSLIQSSYNPPRALSGSSEEASSIQKSALERRARFMAQSRESLVMEELERPLAEYMSLPASQYSVLDAERIERVDENTFRCYVYRIKFFAFEVCPVLLVRVEEKPNGCCIRLLSCKLEGSPVVVAQNEKFSGTIFLSELICRNYV